MGTFLQELPSCPRKCPVSSFISRLPCAKLCVHVLSAGFLLDGSTTPAELSLSNAFVTIRPSIFDLRILIFKPELTLTAVLLCARAGWQELVDADGRPYYWHDGQQRRATTLPEDLRQARDLADQEPGDYGPMPDPAEIIDLMLTAKTVRGPALGARDSDVKTVKAPCGSI